VYAVAFASFGVQAAGLVGDGGILPAAQYFELIGRRLGPDAPWRLPSLCWLVGADTRTLQVLSAAGFACGALLVLDRLPGPAALAAWLLYLSVAAAGQVFLGFQWDALLLEAGILALAVAPWRMGRGLHRTSVVPLLPLWCLVLKLHVLSGWVKLAGGDPTWRDLTALGYHYWTTCLPVWVGWYVAQLPDAVHRASVVVMLAIELVVPFGILGPRRVRHVAACLMIALQLGIAATGNYGFFNLLTIALCATLLDDDALGRLLPRRLHPDDPGRPGPLGRAVRSGVAAVLATLVLLPLAARLVGSAHLPVPARAVLEAVDPLRSFNGYGLFANMTTERPEIVLEASDDGEAWEAYEFRWKPGDPARRPPFVPLHMPRLDWQMWFAALAGYDRTYWFPALLRRLLEGAPDVAGLLAHVPADGRPPRYVRALAYDYTFASPAEHARGLWWHRELLGPYSPVFSVQQGG
jgi:hypothetical protein